MKKIGMVAFLGFVAGCGMQSRRIADVDIPAGIADVVHGEDVASASGEYEPVEVGNLTIRSLDRGTVSSCEGGTHLVMGQTGVRLASFELEADESEAVEVWEFTVSFSERYGSVRSTIRNVRLVDEEGNAFENPWGEIITTAIPENLRTSFYTFVTVPAGGTRQVHLYGDVARFVEGASSGMYLGTSINPDCCSLEAYGEQSGHQFYAPDDRVHYDTPWGSSGLPFRVFATSLAAELAPDSPQGLFSPNVEQVVAKIVLQAAPNIGNVAAVVTDLHTQIQTDMAPEQPVQLNVYRDSFRVENQLFHLALGWGEHGWESRAIGTFQPFEVAAGASRTLYVTLTTSEAVSGDYLQLRDITIGWNDGLSLGALACGAPLDGGRLTY